MHFKVRIVCATAPIYLNIYSISFLSRKEAENVFTILLKLT